MLGYGCTADAQGFFILTKQGLTINGGTFDSFDSTDPAYSTNGQYDPTKAKDACDLGTVLTSVTGAIAITNGARINGLAATGAGSTAQLNGTAAVGTKAWINGANNGIQSGCFRSDLNLLIPDPQLPPGSWLTPAAGTYGGTNYSYVVANGNYQLASLNLNGNKNIAVSGHAVLYVTQDFAMSSSAYVYVSPGSTLVCYIGGKATLGGQGIVNPSGLAGNCILYGLNTCTNFTYSANSALVAIIYAPEAALTSTGPFTGALVANSAIINASGAACHYDEALGRSLLMTAPTPSINAQPIGQSVLAGQTVTFNVAAFGNQPLSYQWQLNGSAIANATTTALLVTNCGTLNAGLYSVVVSNSWGVVTSSNALLTVNYPPAVSQQPVSQAVPVGGGVVLSVGTAGTPPVDFRWRFNGNDVPNATNASLAISNLQAAQMGNYSLVITNAFGSVTSAVALLSLAVPPEFLWARNATNGIAPNFAVISSAHNVAADSGGNAFVTGDFQGSASASLDFGGASLTNSATGLSAIQFFIAKYDRWGSFLWARPVAVTNNQDPVTLRLAADSTGNVYLSGRFAGTAILGTNSLVSVTVSDLFLAKYDSQGQVAWARQISAYDPSSYSVLGLTVDQSGNILLSGRYSGSANFGSAIVTNSAAFLAKFDSSANLLWAKPSLPAEGIAAALSGNIYVTGATSPPAATPGMLAKYDNLGDLVWSRTFPHGQGVALDTNENIYTVGYSGTGTYDGFTVTNSMGLPDFFAAKCNSAGQILWLRQAGSVAQPRATSVAVDALGNLYSGASSASVNRDPSLTFGSSTLTNVFSFIVKYDSTGNALWAKAPGGTNVAAPSALAFVNADEIFLAGRFRARAAFDKFNLFDNNPTASGDFYLAKLAGTEPPAPPHIIGQPVSQSVPVGATASFSVTVPSGIPLGYRWFFNGTNIVPGAAGSSLVLSNVQAADIGGYQAIVTNAYGSATSAVATLIVYPTNAGTLGPTVTFSGNQVHFPVAGAPGFSFMIEASTNLVEWLPVMTNISPFVFGDAYTTNFPQRFYRSVYRP